MKTENPPSGLGAAGRALWRRLAKNFDFADAASIDQLERLCRLADRVEQAREIIAKDGLVVTDRFGRPQRHPAVVIERDCLAQMIACFKLLGLQEVGAAGRPAGVR